MENGLILYVSKFIISEFLKYIKKFKSLELFGLGLNDKSFEDKKR